MAYALMVAGEWQQLAGPFVVGEGEDAIQYCADWPNRATAEERAALGVAEIAEAGEQPEDVRVIDIELIDVDGVPTRTWVTEPFTLEDAQTICWARAQVYREQQKESGCNTASGRVQTNADSQRIISGAVQAADLSKRYGQPFSMNFTMADNSVVALTADEMIALGLAVAARISACHDVGTGIRDAINAATTAEEAFAVPYQAGYPA
jgi:hypothetical protein